MKKIIKLSSKWVDENAGEVLNNLHRGTGIHKDKKKFNRKEKHKQKITKENW